MSYNKLKSLVANVEAIETVMKIQVQGRQATAEKKKFYPDILFRGYQRSVEYRYGQAHKW